MVRLQGTNRLKISIDYENKKTADEPSGHRADAGLHRRIGASGSISGVLNGLAITEKQGFLGRDDVYRLRRRRHVHRPGLPVR